jgi:hypothetical protein
MGFNSAFKGLILFCFWLLSLPLDIKDAIEMHQQQKNKVVF